MKNTILWLSVASLCLASMCAWSGTIYKCKNAAGVMLYQEKPCEKEVQSVSSWASTSGVEVEGEVERVEQVKEGLEEARLALLKVADALESVS